MGRDKGPIDLLEALHPTTQSAERAPWWTVCTFDGRVKVKFIQTAEDALAAAELMDRQEPSGVYFSLGGWATRSRKGGRGSEAGVVAVSAAWVDIDALDFRPLLDTRERLEGQGIGARAAKEEAWRTATEEEREWAKNEGLEALFGLPVDPSAIVDSGRGWHAYWFFDRPVRDRLELAKVKALNRWIANQVGGDCAVDLARVLRVPGTWNRKDELHPLPCQIHDGSWVSYTLDDLVQKLGAQLELPSVRKAPPKPKRRKPEPLRVGPIPDGWTDYLERSEPARKAWAGEGFPSRSEAAMSLAQMAVNSGHARTIDDVLAILVSAPGTGSWADEKPHAAEVTAAKAMDDSSRARTAALASDDDGLLPSRPGQWTDEEEALWRSRLRVTSRDKVEGSATNAAHCFKHPQWLGAVAFDDRAGEPVFLRPPPWKVPDGPWPRRLMDTDYTRIKVWMEVIAEVNVPIDLVRRITQVMAEAHRYDPVQSYLQGLEWDKQPRADDWLIRYLGAPDTEYVRAVSRKWLISAVGRAMTPGCKVDTVLCLEGPQGAGKSTAIQTLCHSRWYKDDLGDLMSKEAAQGLQGIWVLEIAELDQHGPKTIATLKAFLSRSEDLIRLPYAARFDRFPRRCVFAATTNRDAYLQDETGNRRWWPVKTEKVLETEEIRAGLKRERDQIWAEAYDAWKSGERWWIDDRRLQEAAFIEAESRQEVDPWEEELQYEVHALGETNINDCLKALKLKPREWNRYAQMRIAAILKGWGWARKRKTMDDGSRQWVYVSPEEEARQSR